MKEIKRHSTILAGLFIFSAAVAGLLMLPGLKRGGSRPYVNYLPVAPTVQAAEVNPWTVAVAKIKEDRGEPMGKQAKVDIPHQVRHYSDTRRFLAVQVAEVREHGFHTPRDLVDLGKMIESGEMVPVEPVTENYILFGVGGHAGTVPFTRYENGQSISLFNEAGLNREYARLAESTSRFERELAGLRKEFGSLGRRDRTKRAKLQAQITATEKSLRAERENKESLDRHYGSAAKRTELLGAYESLESLSKTFSGRDFDINEPAARRDMKVRMLSSLRPEAAKVLNEIAAAYREKFNRPLPITSLVRPDEYQHALSKVNPNATRIETPPHSTGLAFDVYYRYMTAAEQAHVMSHLAALKDAGRIEVLRENRDHYHVFAFVDGAKPSEGLISATLGRTAVAKAAPAARPSTKVAGKATKKSAGKQVAKKQQRAKATKSRKR